MSVGSRTTVIGAILLTAALGVPGVSTASRDTPKRAALPTPGTPSQVAGLVASSSKIEKLPSPLVPLLQNAGYDNASNYYPVIKQQCSGTSHCVFGDKTSKTTVVLFGDSHAAMWLPPLVYDATHLNFRIVLLWYAACPAASVTVWNPSQHEINKGCNAWRAQSITDIKALSPNLILMSDRTTAVDGAGGKAIPDATWRAGMEQTISDFHGAKPKVAVIGDITALTNEMPECLAAHPTKIQDCSSPNPNPGFMTHVKDELLAAKAAGVTYINPQGWLCTKKCSPVIGNMVVYYDYLHTSATYAEYLSLVLEAKVKPLLPTG